VPNYRELGVNVSASGRDADARFRAELAMVRDENTGLFRKAVQIARKNLRNSVRGRGAGG